jgi:hypothetical protein
VRVGTRPTCPVKPLSVTGQDFAEQWLTRMQMNVQPNTHASYAETLHRYVLRPGSGIGLRDPGPGELYTHTYRALQPLLAGIEAGGGSRS